LPISQIIVATGIEIEIATKSESIPALYGTRLS